MATFNKFMLEIKHWLILLPRHCLGNGYPAVLEKWRFWGRFGDSGQKSVAALF